MGTLSIQGFLGIEYSDSEVVYRSLLHPVTVPLAQGYSGWLFS